MSKTEAVTQRSYAKILPKHLNHLASMARSDLEAFFYRNPELARLYRRRLLCVLLCQGAALHFVDGHNGVKDFDVWTFFAEHPQRRFPRRRRITNADFGPSVFGRNP